MCFGFLTRSLWSKSGSEPWVAVEDHEARIKSISGEMVTLTTADNVKIQAVWSQAKIETQSTAVLFHGTANCLTDFTPLAEWYRNQGFNVLMTSYRGFPHCDGDSRADREWGMLQDVAAAVAYLRKKEIPSEKTVAHGVSLGGSAAAIAALYSPGMHLTLSHTFTSVAELIIAIGKRHTCGVAPKGLLHWFVNKAIPFGLRVETSIGEMHTDGLNTLAKLTKVTGQVFVDYGDEDELIPNEFALRLLRASRPDGEEPYDGKEEDHPRIARMRGGGHMGLVIEDSVLAEKYKQHLMNLGLLPS